LGNSLSRLVAFSSRFSDKKSLSEAGPVATPKNNSISGQVLGASTASTSLQNQIENILNQYLAEGKLQGGMEENGVDSGSGMVQHGDGRTTAVIGGTPIVSYYPPLPNQTFTGGSVAGITNLSSQNNATQNETISNALTVLGSATINGLTVSGPVTLSTVNIASSTVNSLTANNFSVVGNVGIGTTTPAAYPLVVSGNANFVGHAAFGNASAVDQNSWPSILSLNDNLKGDLSSSAFFQGVQDNSSYTHTGINPASIIGYNLYSSISASSTGPIQGYFGLSSTINNNGLGHTVLETGSSGYAVYSGSGGVDTLQGAYNATQANGSGLVGTDQATQSLLYAANQSQIISGWAYQGGLYMSGSSTVGTYYGFQSKINLSNASHATTTYGIYVAAPTGSGTITNKYALVTEPNSGNVGVGTTTPLASLVLQGSGAGDVLDIASSSGTSLFHVAASGNVGVGTTTPAEELSVVGGTILNTPGATGIKFVSSVSIGSCGSFGNQVFSYAAGRYVYTACLLNSFLTTVDVSNPKAPLVVGNQISIVNHPRNFLVAGNYAFYSSGDGGTVRVNAADVSNPSAPVALSSVGVGNGGGNPRGFAMNGKYIYYVLNSNNGVLGVVDASNPSSLRQITPNKSGFTKGLSYGVAISGRYLYTLDPFDSATTTALYVFDLLNPISPVLVASTTMPGAGAQSIYATDRYVYATNASSTWIDILDVSNPLAPAYVTNVNVGANSQNMNMVLAGRYGYFTNEASSTVIAVDFSNPAAPVVVSTVATCSNPREPSINGRYLYVPCADGNMYIYDVSGVDTNSITANSGEIGNLQIRNKLYVKGQAVLSDGLQVGWGGIFSAGALAIAATSTPSYFGGNVGIGTTSPSQLLSVAGNMQLTGALYDGSNSPGTSGMILQSTGVATKWVTAALSQWINSGSKIGYTVGYVGIGTTSPSGPLQVYAMAGSGSAQHPLASLSSNSLSQSTQDKNEGYSFMPTKSGKVTELWARVHDTQTHAVRLYDGDTGNVLASTTIIGVVDTWVSATITPVSLTVNATYVVAVRIGSGTSDNESFSPFTSIGDIDIDYGVYISASNAMPTNFDLNNLFGEADITFIPSISVPVFTILANGNVGIGTSSPPHLITLSGGAYSDGASWTNVSDRNLKENFATLTPADILQKIDMLPVNEWNYKTESAITTHIGPTAQDFYAAFGLNGEAGQTSISTIDPAGVALLGIQALDQKILALQGALTGNATASNLSVLSPAVFSGDSVGEAKILAGQTSVRVTFTEPYKYQPIVTADVVDVFIEHMISNVDATGFNVNIPEVTPADITFNWHSFASPAEQLTVSDGSKIGIQLIVEAGSVQAPILTVSSDTGSSTPDSYIAPSSTPPSEQSVLGTSTGTPDAIVPNSSSSTPPQEAGSSPADTSPAVIPPPANPAPDLTPPPATDPVPADPPPQ
jgi:hypothetical protein